MAPQAQSSTVDDRKPGRVIELPAKPQAVSIDTARSALIVVDMQNDFGAKGGMFDRAGIDISMIQEAVGPTAKVLAAARETSMPVVFLKMAFKPDLSDAGPGDAPNWLRHLALGVGQSVQAPTGVSSRVLIRETWNTEILPELAPQEQDYIVYKHRFSGFYETELNTLLTRLRVKYLIVAGCTTSVCVESTIRDAMFRDYSPVLLADCTAEPIGHELARSNYEASLLLIESLFGWVSVSDELLAALANSGSAQNVSDE